MTRHVEEIKNKLSYLRSNINVLDLLMEFERTMDNANIYAYKNWMEGELVDGPDIDRYWVTVKFMFPYTKMPDPMGGMRLQKYGCKVSFDKDKFKSPVKVTGRDSYSDFARRKAKIKTHNVWIVTVTMPRRLLDERILDTIERYEGENSLDIDTSDISQAYDENVEVEDLDMGFEGGSEGGDMGEGEDEGGEF